MKNEQALKLLDSPEFFSRSLDDIIRGLEIPKLNPKRFFLWHILPDRIKQGLLNEDKFSIRVAQQCLPTITGLLAIPATCLLIYGASFDSTLSAIVGVTGLLLASIFFIATLENIDLTSVVCLSRLSDEDKKYEILTHYRSILESHRNELIGKKGKFTKLKSDLDRQIDKVAGVAEDISDMLQDTPSNDSNYDLTQVCYNQAYETWSMLIDEQAAVAKRQDRVLSAFRQMERQVNRFDTRNTLERLVGQLDEVRKDTSRLLHESQQMFHEFLLNLAEDVQKLETVSCYSQKYIASVNDSLLLTEPNFAEHNLVAATIAGEEFDKVTEDWLPELQIT